MEHDGGLWLIGKYGGTGSWTKPYLILLPVKVAHSILSTMSPVFLCKHLSGVLLALVGAQADPATKTSTASQVGGGYLLLINFAAYVRMDLGMANPINFYLASMLELYIVEMK
jgi:hypothetical protein